jgi:GH43 family beta-xylosidase
VFTGNARVYGVGHASFVTSSDSAEFWIVYHTKDSPTPGWRRSVHMQPFRWSASGDPTFGAAVAGGERLHLPSGECQ